MIGTETIDPISDREERSLQKEEKNSVGIPYVHPSTTGPPTWFSPPPSVNPKPPSNETHTRSLTPPFIVDNEVWPEDKCTSLLCPLSDPFRAWSSYSTRCSSPHVTDRPLQRMEAILPRLCRSQANPKGRVPHLDRPALRFSPKLLNRTEPPQRHGTTRTKKTSRGSWTGSWTRFTSFKRRRFVPYPTAACNSHSFRNTTGT